MRVLQLIASLHPGQGGTVEATRQLSAGLHDAGCPTDVACADTPGSPWLRGFPAEVFALGGGRRALRGYGYSATLLAWLESNSHAYDALIVHGLWQFPSLAAFLATRRAGPPYFIYAHGMLTRASLGWSRARRLKKALYWRLVERRVVEHAAGVLFASDQERGESASAWFEPGRRAHIVGHGIRDPEHGAGTIPLRGERHHFVLLGRVHPIKGIEVAMHAAAQLPGHVRLVVAGMGAPAYEERLRGLAASLGIADRVEFAGHVTGDAKWQLLRRAHALVSASHHENFGIAVAESLAVGCPVIVTRRVAVWPAIAASGGGFVCDPGPAALAAAMARVAALDAGEAHGLSRRARACFEANFRIEPAVGRLRNLLARSADRAIP